MATARGIRKSSNEFRAIVAMVNPEELGITDPKSPSRSGVDALVNRMMTVTTTEVIARLPSTTQ